MKKTLLLSAIAATTCLSSFAFVPSKMTEKPAWVRVMDNYTHEYNGTENVPVYMKGGLTLQLDENDNLIATDFIRPELIDDQDFLKIANDLVIKFSYFEGNWRPIVGEKAIPTALTKPSGDDLAQCDNKAWFILYENEEYAYVLMPYVSYENGLTGLKEDIQISTWGDEYDNRNSPYYNTPEEDKHYDIWVKNVNIRKLSKATGKYYDIQANDTFDTENNTFGVEYYLILEDVVYAASEIRYSTYSVNATATDYLFTGNDFKGVDASYNVEGEESNLNFRSAYPIYITTVQNNSFKIRNFGNWGSVYDYSFVDGTVQNTPLELECRFNIGDDGKGTATIANYTNEPAIDAYDVTGFYSKDEKTLYVNRLLGENGSMAIEGQVEAVNLAHHGSYWRFSSEANNRITNIFPHSYVDGVYTPNLGGTTDYEIMNFEFPAYTVNHVSFIEYNDGSNSFETVSDGKNEAYTFVGNTKIAINEKTPVTPVVKFNLLEYSYGPIRWLSIGKERPEDTKYLYLKCEVEKDVNCDNVTDDFEIYMVPGSQGGMPANIMDFANEAKNGHTGGQLVSVPEYDLDALWEELEAPKLQPKDGEETYSTMADEAVNSNKKVYQIVIPQTDPKVYYNSIIDNGGSSVMAMFGVYVKAQYDNGLEPTYHDYEKVFDTQKVPTGVEDVIGDVVDQDAPVFYYNMNGVQVNGDNLTPGLYIKRQGNVATKVLVK